MKQKCIMLIILGLSILLLISCEYKDGSQNKLDKINSDITLEEALDLFGTPHQSPSDTSSIYPFVYSWEIGDGEVLYLIFERDDQKEFKEKIDNEVYVLPEEVVRYEENGLRQLTDNELKVIGEWVMDHTPVCAYTEQNGEKNVLFDLR